MKLFATPSQRIYIPISPVWLAKRLLGFALLLIVFSLIGVYARLYTDYDGLHRYVHHAVDKTNVDAELSIPAFFGTLLLLGSGILCWLISRDRTAANLHTKRWTALSLIFLLLAMDEATSFHEFLNVQTLRTYVPSSKFLLWTWVIPGALFVLIVFVLYVPFLWSLPRQTAGLMLLAGAVFVGGALGVEVIGSAFHTVNGGHSLSYRLTAHLEELLEMTGLIIFIYALSDYLTANWSIVIQHRAQS